MGKHDVVDFNRGMIVWGIWAGLSLSETDDLQGFFLHMTVFRFLAFTRNDGKST